MIPTRIALFGALLITSAPALAQPYQAAPPNAPPPGGPPQARERGPGVCLADSTSTCRGYACVPRRVDSRVQVAGDSNDVFSSALIAFLDRKIPEAQRHFRKYTSARPKL